MELVELVKKLPFYKKLSNSEVEYVIENSRIIKKEKGSLMFNCKQGCSGLIYLLSGEIRTFMISNEGREITLFRLMPNDICVLSASCVISQITFETEMTIEKDCTILLLNSTAFSKLVEENIYVKSFMYELLTKRFSQVVGVMQQLLFMSFDKRLAMFLIKESDINKDNIISKTHEEIAKQTNSAREVVARMLKKFEYDNLINYSRGKIEIIDKEKLLKLIDDNVT